MERVIPLSAIGLAYLSISALELWRCALSLKEVLSRVSRHYDNYEYEEAMRLIRLVNRDCSLLLLLYAYAALASVVAPALFFGPRSPQKEVLEMGWNVIYLFLTVVHVAFLTWVLWRAKAINDWGQQAVDPGLGVLIDQPLLNEELADHPPALRIGSTPISTFQVVLGGVLTSVGCIWGLVQHFV